MLDGTLTVDLGEPPERHELERGNVLVVQPGTILQLRRLRERLAERGVELELTDDAKAAIAEAGWDPAYGARPLKRAIQRMLENPLALELLEGRFAEGDTVRVDVGEDGELVFERAEVAAPAAA